jgi:ABC-type sugar transport system substrate-binding protein
MIRRGRFGLAAAAAAALALTLAACSGATTPSTGSSGSGSAGTLEGKGKTIVAFVVSTANNYVGADVKAMQAEADKLDYKLEVISNNFSQTQEDQQIRQYLSGGQKPAAFLYWPANNDSGANSARLLSKTAPVFLLAGALNSQNEAYVTARAGQDNVAIGKQMGTNLLEAISDAKAAGATFHGPGGKPNVLEVTFMAGYEAGVLRHQGWTSVAGKDVNLLSTENVQTPDSQGGFTAASQVIPKYQSQGIDFVVAGSNNMGAGVVKALQQSGITPGKDVYVVAGDFSGDKQPLRSGLIQSAVLQSPVIEGTLIIQTAARYLSTGKTVAGTTTLKATEEEPALANTPPSKSTIMPHAGITLKNIDTLKVWGKTVDELEP